MVSFDEHASEKKSFLISGPADVVAARRFTKTYALALDFSEQQAEQLVLVVAELGSNIYKHAGRGTLTISRLQVEQQVGVCIEARDWGSGIIDQERVFEDGYSTVGTLGDGLGAVNRLVDALEITSDGENGTHIIATKMLWQERSGRERRYECPFDIGAASRAFPGLHVNGDAFVIKHWDGYSLVAVIDGVGHGTYAHKAAISAKAYIETHFRQDIAHLFMGAARACRATRGVVMTLVVLDWSNREIHYAGIGNIETRTCNTSQDKQLSIRRGIVGVKMPVVRVSKESWNEGAIMVLHSDGISSKWQWQQLLIHESATAIAQRILRGHARDNDDATVLVIKDKVSRNRD